jgi:hypothetical protein
MVHRSDKKDQEKKARLEAKGWKVGSAAEFLGMTPPTPPNPLHREKREQGGEAPGVPLSRGENIRDAYELVLEDTGKPQLR